MCVWQTYHTSLCVGVLITDQPHLSVLSAAGGIKRFHSNVTKRTVMMHST